MTPAEAMEKLGTWMLAEAERAPYAEIGFTLVLHDGRVSRVEKSIVEKTKPTDGRGQHYGRG